MSLLDDNFEKDYAKNAILGCLYEAFLADNSGYKINHIYQHLNGNMVDVNYDDMLCEANNWFIYYTFYRDKDEFLVSFLFCKRDVNVKEVPRAHPMRNWYGGVLSIEDCIKYYGVIRR